MTTGLHRVQDIACIKCREVLGWTYVGGYLSLLDNTRIDCFSTLVVGKGLQRRKQVQGREIHSRERPAHHRTLNAFTLHMLNLSIMLFHQNGFCLRQLSILHWADKERAIIFTISLSFIVLQVPTRLVIFLNFHRVYRWLLPAIQE